MGDWMNLPVCMPNVWAASFTSSWKCQAMEPVKCTSVCVQSYCITLRRKKSVKHPVSRSCISDMSRWAERNGVKLAKKRLACG